VICHHFCLPVSSHTMIACQQCSLQSSDKLLLSVLWTALHCQQKPSARVHHVREKSSTFVLEYDFTATGSVCCTFSLTFQCNVVEQSVYKSAIVSENNWPEISILCSLKHDQCCTLSTVYRSYNLLSTLCVSANQSLPGKWPLIASEDVHIEQVCLFVNFFVELPWSCFLGPRDMDVSSTVDDACRNEQAFDSKSFSDNYCCQGQCKENWISWTEISMGKCFHRQAYILLLN